MHEGPPDVCVGERPPPPRATRSLCVCAPPPPASPDARGPLPRVGVSGSAVSCLGPGTWEKKRNVGMLNTTVCIQCILYVHVKKRNSQSHHTHLQTLQRDSSHYRGPRARAAGPARGRGQRQVEVLRAASRRTCGPLYLRRGREACTAKLFKALNYCGEVLSVSTTSFCHYYICQKRTTFSKTPRRDAPQDLAPRHRG